MIILVMNDKTIDSVSKIKDTGELDHYNLIERYYSGKILDNPVLLCDSILQDLQYYMMNVETSSIIIFNNLDRLFDLNVLEYNLDDNNEALRNNIKLLLGTLNRLNTMSHRILIVGKTNNTIFDSYAYVNNVETHTSLINVLNDISREGLNENVDNDSISEDELIDVMAKFEE